MTRTLRRRTPILFALLALWVAPACQRGGSAPAPSDTPGSGDSVADEAVTPDEDTAALVLYCGRNETLVAPLLERFEAETGIDVRVNYAGTSQLAATVLEEGENSPADVFFAQDASTLGLLQARNVLAELPAELLEQVPERYRSPGGHWVGTSGRARVVVYNTERVQPDQLPTELAGYAKPEWRGRVGWAPENASFQSFLTALVQMDGKEAAEGWVTEMLANEPRAYPSNTPAVIAVGTGEIDVALTNHYYLYRILEERGPDFPIANHFAANGRAESLVNVAGVGILETATNTEAAQRFIAFLLSAESQAFFAAENAEFPLVEGVAGREGLPTILELNGPEIDLSNLHDLEAAVGILQRTGAL